MLSLSVFVLGCKNNDNVTSEENLDESFEEIEEISINDDKIEDLCNLARERAKSENFDEAIDLYSKAIELGKRDYLYAERGQVKKYSRDLNGALEDMNKALKLGKESWFYAERGQIKKDLGDLNVAVEDMNEALKLSKERWISAERGTIKRDL